MEKKEEFKIGDVVKMQSGSPLMTVVEVYDDHKQIKCSYFDNQFNMVVLPFEAVYKPTE